MKHTTETIRTKLKDGKPSIGSWMQIPNASAAEIMGQAGYDWLAIDMEHGSVSLDILPDLFRAISLGPTVPFVRVAQNHPNDIKQALDAGAAGIIIPMIENYHDLTNAISSALYPPRGKRGVGYSRANMFGKNFSSYNQTINDELVIIAQIEHIDAVDDIDNILSADRLDGIMIGPYDLSASMGLTAQFDDEQFQNALNSLQQAANRNNIPMGLHIVQPDPVELKQRIDEGYQFIAYGIDAVFLNNGAQCPSVH